jgi:hypothetical protein
VIKDGIAYRITAIAKCALKVLIAMVEQLWHPEVDINASIKV